MAKYVNNAFSTKMLDSNCAYAQFEISESEFMHKSHQEDVTCVIGHPDTAEMFQFTENRQTLKLQDGDILYVCEMNNPSGTRLPIGITLVKELPQGFYFRFLEIQIFKIPLGIRIKKFLENL